MAILVLVVSLSSRFQMPAQHCGVVLNAKVTGTVEYNQSTPIAAAAIMIKSDLTEEFAW
jgi:hypothetical protein